ncbi:MAG: hypothetical protein WAW52_12625 [Methanothrix sp.]
MSRKGKSRTRIARRDIIRTNASNARRKARQQAKAYDRTKYDGSEGAGGSRHNSIARSS